ncbi:hypothetical protein [Helicobacter sp. 23-1045]
MGWVIFALDSAISCEILRFVKSVLLSVIARFSHRFCVFFRHCEILSSKIVAIH